jgi:elongation factor G
MGELHLEIIVDRMMREFGVGANVGKPQVAYRETIRHRREYDYTHKKQTGGSGQYARTKLRVEPIPGRGFEFENDIKGGNIPKEFIPAIEKGVVEALEAAFWPAIRCRTSRSRCSTAPITTSIRRKWRSRSAARSA